MEIIVEGLGEKLFTPNKVILSLTFNERSNNYNDVLEKGANLVSNFINTILLKLDFNKEDLKTRNYIIREEKKYDDITREYLPNGFSFKQNATLEFDYDKNILANFIEELSMFSQSVSCNIDFGIKELHACKRNILALAYDDAKLKAEAIALAAGLKLVKCAKVDFKPLTTCYVSRSSFGPELALGECSNNIASKITNTFNPEDILVSENLYCLWIAE